MSKPEIQQASKRRLKRKKPVCTHKVYKGPGPYLHCVWCWKRLGQKKSASELKKLRARARAKRAHEVNTIMASPHWERFGRSPGHRFVGLKRYDALTSRHRNKRSCNWFWFVVQRGRKAHTTLAWGYSKTERVAQDCVEAIIETVDPYAERATPP